MPPTAEAMPTDTRHAADPPPRTVVYRLGFWVRTLLMVGWFLFSSAVGLVMAAVRYGDPTNSRRFSRMNAWLALRLAGITVSVSDEDRLWGARPCVYVTNHQANEDIFIHGWIFPSRSVVTGKREIIRIPVFGFMFKAMGNVLLDRANRHTAVKQLSEAAERIRREGISVWIFPEGHRNRKPELLAFKRGAFHLAVLAQVPIVPIATQQYERILSLEKQNLRSGTVHLDVLEPIPTLGLTDADVPELTTRVQSLIQDALARMGPS